MMEPNRVGNVSIEAIRSDLYDAVRALQSSIEFMEAAEGKASANFLNQTDIAISAQLGAIVRRRNMLHNLITELDKCDN